MYAFKKIEHIELHVCFLIFILESSKIWKFSFRNSNLEISDEN